MTELEQALARIASELADRGVKWCLVGGLAVGTRAEPRTTRDVDVAVSVANDDEAEQLVAHLRSQGYSIGMVLEQDALGRLATVRTISPGLALPVVVDLLFASSGIEPQICAAAELIEIVPGLSVPVARAGHLIALKLLARDDRSRPQDLDDARALLRYAEPGELERARDAVRAIAACGAARGRDLVAALDELLAEGEP